MPTAVVGERKVESKMEIVMQIDKVGGMFYIRPKKAFRGIADFERCARRNGFYGPEWELVKATSGQLVFKRGAEKSIVTYEIKN